MSRQDDFAFLDGSFDVEGRRLGDPLDPGSGWTDLPATSSAVLLFGGAVSVDEMWFPGQQRFGLSLRLFEPAARAWTVRWLDGRGGGLQPPVTGRWRDGRCWLTGADSHAGRPVLASYAWSDVTADDARWEQCFSTDDGRTWSPNWTMRFVRRRRPVDHPRLPRLATDFDFLEGRWDVHHRRVLDPVGHALGRPSETVEFDGVHVGRTFVAGTVSVDETTLAEPGRRGLTFRVFDQTSGQWSIHWVDSRVGRLEPPVRGGFADGIGTFEGTERLGGHDVRVRFSWSDVTPTTARWRQWFSVDGGCWDENWEMTFSR